MLVPELCALAILHRVERHTRSTLVLPEGVTHRGDWLHWALIVDVLWLDRDDSKVIVQAGVRILRVHRLILQLNLLLRVQNDVEIASSMPWHLLLVEPAGQYGQFPLVPRQVAAFQILLVLRSDLCIRALSISEILDKQVLAEGRVAFLQPALVLNLQVELIDPLSESIFIHIDEDCTDFARIELLKAEWVHDDFARDIGSSLHLSIV